MAYKNTLADKIDLQRYYLVTVLRTFIINCNEWSAYVYTDLYWYGILYMCSRNTRRYIAIIWGLSPYSLMRLRWFIRCTDTVDSIWRPSVEVIASIYKIFKWDSLPTARYFFCHKQCCLCQPTHCLFWGNTQRMLRNLFGCKLLCKNADIGHAWPVRHARPRRQWWCVVFRVGCFLQANQFTFGVTPYMAKPPKRVAALAFNVARVETEILPQSYVESCCWWLTTTVGIDSRLCRVVVRWSWQFLDMLLTI